MKLQQNPYSKRTSLQEAQYYCPELLRTDQIKSDNIFHLDIFKYEFGLTKCNLIPKYRLLQRSFIHRSFSDDLHHRCFSTPFKDQAATFLKKTIFLRDYSNLSKLTSNLPKIFSKLYI